MFSLCAHFLSIKPLMPLACERSQCTRCWNQSGPVWEQNPGDFNGFPPAADVSWCTAAAVFALVGRVCCVNTCLTSGAAHAQCADTLMPFVVSYRSAHKHVNMRAASEDGVFPHTWTRNTCGSRFSSLPFYHRQEFLFCCRFACFWATKSVQLSF